MLLASLSMLFNRLKINENFSKKFNLNQMQSKN